ncbi:MAG: hypothetical protein ACRDQ5_23945 [Sciscionella sp.]
MLRIDQILKKEAGRGRRSGRSDGVPACDPFTNRVRILDEQFDAHHPHDRPHHHLALLATRPDAQCRGLGSALLD